MLSGVGCIPCPPGQFWVPSYTCEPCNLTRCRECVSSAITCTSCNSPYELIESTQQCYRIDCLAGLFYDYPTDSCKSCPVNCDECKGDSCLRCASDYWKSTVEANHVCTKSAEYCPFSEYKELSGICSYFSDWGQLLSNMAGKVMYFDTPGLRVETTSGLDDWYRYFCGT